MPPVKTDDGFCFNYNGKNYDYSIDQPKYPSMPHVIAVEVQFQNLDNEDRKIFKDFRVEVQNGTTVDRETIYSDNRELQRCLLAKIKDDLVSLNIIVK